MLFEAAVSMEVAAVFAQISLGLLLTVSLIAGWMIALIRLTMDNAPPPDLPFPKRPLRRAPGLQEDQ